MKRPPGKREWTLIDSALAKAAGYGFDEAVLAPGFRARVTVETMNPRFKKFHLGRGFALHLFTGVDLGPPHDHPCDFATLILEPYAEEVYALAGDGWSSQRFSREAGTSRLVPASTIHSIVELPAGQGLTLVRYGPHTRATLFYRFGMIAESKTLRGRIWRPACPE